MKQCFMREIQTDVRCQLYCNFNFHQAGIIKKLRRKIPARQL